MRAPTINYTLIGYYASFVAMHSACYTANNSVRNFSAMDPCCSRKSQWEAILHCHKSTPCVVSEKNWNITRTKVTHGACYVAAAVGEKACFRMK